MSANPTPPKRKNDDPFHTYSMLLMAKRNRQLSNISTNNSAIPTKFTMKLSNHILQQNLTTQSKNIVFSPLSVDTVLHIVALGSKGETLKQLLDLIECKELKEFSESMEILGDVVKDSNSTGGDDECEIDICFANGVWVDQRYPLKQRFQEIVGDLHKAEIMTSDFKNQPDEVVKQANLWVDKKSKGLIKEILSKGCFEDDTVMLLANALYFKGTWVEKFHPAFTSDRNFHLLNGKNVKVPFMHKQYYEFDYGTLEGCQVLRMMYRQDKVQEGEKGRSFSMYIFLPKKKKGLPDLLSKLEMDSTMFMEKIKLKYELIAELAIPKFKFDCNIPLKTTMMELGLTLPFDINSKDITEIVESRLGDWLYIEDIFQKSRVEVDEDGTIAASLTMLRMRGGGGPRIPPPSFIADHPFMFLIREDYSGAILFVGTLLNP